MPYQLTAPIWNGGRRTVGIADFRLGTSGVMQIEFTYIRKKDGRRSFPDVYEMEVNKIRTYPTQILDSGVKLYLVPLDDWDIVERRTNKVETPGSEEKCQEQKPEQPKQQPLFEDDMAKIISH